MAQDGLTLMDLKPGLTFEKVGNRFSIYFPTEGEAEVMYIAISEAERKGSSITFDFHEREA